MYGLCTNNRVKGAELELDYKDGLLYYGAYNKSHSIHEDPAISHKIGFSESMECMHLCFSS